MKSTDTQQLLALFGALVRQRAAETDLPLVAELKVDAGVINKLEQEDRRTLYTARQLGVYAGPLRLESRRPTINECSAHVREVSDGVVALVVGPQGTYALYHGLGEVGLNPPNPQFDVASAGFSPACLAAFWQAKTIQDAQGCVLNFAG